MKKYLMAALAWSIVAVPTMALSWFFDYGDGPGPSLAGFLAGLAALWAGNNAFRYYEDQERSRYWR